MTPTDGTVASGYEGVAAAFERAFDGAPDMGAAVALWVDGHPVVDLWGGVARPAESVPWQRDTATVVFSCTKGLVSLLAARLVQDGRLDYDAPVAAYWPEFAAAGKEGVLVRHLLSHRSGLSAPIEALTRDDVLDWSRVTERLAAQAPIWEPGTGYAYHAITHGWLIGEVIRRITGLSVGEYFAELAARPLSADVWIGLPDAEQARVAEIRVGQTLHDLIAQQARDRAPDRIDWSDRAMTLGGAFPPELVGPGEAFNDPRVRAAEIPGAGGIATARGLAAVWSATVVPTSGVRVLDDAVLDEALVVQSEGSPVFDVPPPWPRWAMGFQLDSEARRYLGPTSFGHDGAGGQVAFADRDARVGFAFVTNQMEAVDDRATRIIEVVRDLVTR